MAQNCRKEKNSPINIHMKAVTLHYEYTDSQGHQEEQLTFIQDSDGSWRCELSDEQMQAIIRAGTTQD